MDLNQLTLHHVAICECFSYVREVFNGHQVEMYGGGIKVDFLDDVMRSPLNAS